MARPGILYSDVARVAAKLAAAGTNPTVDSVREALGGTGSKSTIAPLLKRWKIEQQEAVAAAEAGLPASLVQAVKALHEHMQSEFAQQRDQAQQAHDGALRAAAAREGSVRTELQALAIAHAAQAEELGQAQAAFAHLQATHHTQSLRLATVEAENAGLQQRLADRTTEVNTLDRQLSQTRTQFEHYQEATAVQRTEERQGYEQRIARVEQDFAGASRHIAAQQSTIGQQEAKLSLLTADYERNKQALQVVQAELAEIRSERDRLSDRLDDTIAAKESMAAQFLMAQQQLTETRMALAAKEREVTLLAEQIRRAEEHVASLASEKNNLLQVRAALEQQLCQAPTTMLQGGRKSD